MEIMETLRQILGVDVAVTQLEPGQAMTRAVVIYVLGLIVVRCGSKRLLGRSTAFDTIVGVMVGSLLSRSVNGASPLLATLAATGVLVALHWAIGFVSHSWEAFDRVFNGTPTALISEGRPDHRAMWRSAVSHRDIEESARKQVQTSDLERLSHVFLERNGSIVTWKRTEPWVVDVRVEAGVQTVRLELG